MLQHRGQDSAGIVSFDGSRFRERKARRVQGSVQPKPDEPL